MNLSTRIFHRYTKSLTKFVHDFLKNCFREPKLLLAANKLIFLNTLYQ